MEENCVKRKFVNRSIHKKSENGHSVIRESSHRVCLPCKRPGGGKAWYIYETGRHKTGQSAEDAERDPAYVRESGTTGCTAEAGIRTVCQIGDSHPQSVGTDGKAFLTGGIICCIGQGILNYTGNVLGMDPQTAGSWCSLILVFASVVLTALHIYPKIVKWGGAGALVPITGFANSVTAPAVEYQKEGQVFGIGCKIFTIAGPVILYGIFASWALGLICWVLQMFGIQL